MSENIDRAKGHFQEVKNHMPKERQQADAQAQNTAHTTKTKATELRKTADNAMNEAQNAKTAVADAKNNLRQVQQSGQQTIREVKLDTAQKNEDYARQSPRPARKRD